MADIYVRSTDGNNADSGATWALAKADLTGAAAIDAAGDTIWLSQNHAETTAGAVTVALAGTPTNPVRVLCGNDAAEPPTSLATTATVTVSTGANLSLQGSAYFYGTSFISAGQVSLNAQNTDGVQTFSNCKFRTTNIGSAGIINLGSANNVTQQTVLEACTLEHDATGNSPVMVRGFVHIKGGSFAGQALTNGMFQCASDRTLGRLLVDGMDFSALASTVNLVRGGATPRATALFVFRNCLLPASWSGGVVSAAISSPGQRYEMWNCDSADTNYRIWIEDFPGSIRHSTTVYKDAFSGGTKHSYVFATNTNPNYPNLGLVGPEFFADNATTGSSVTATVEVVTDNVTLKDDECWLEVMYMGTSGAPLGTWVSDAKANVLATAANQTTSTESWTTTGLTTPVKQKLSVTFTPQEAGYVIGRVVLAKASTTVYVDPELKLT